MSLPVSEAARPADASLSLQFDDADADLLARAFRTPGDGPRAWALNGEAHRISLINGFDRLLAWPTLRGVVRYPHQERTCLRVRREMRGRAILADEVGPGKTIEAGLLLKEYTIRGLVRRALILTPASLTGQWREEMESKFELPFAVLRFVGDWERRPLLVASIDTAKRDPHRVWAQRTSWDLVIVDEAHRLKNRLSVNWRFVAGLSKKYMLLLTATPVQNDMDQLLTLIVLQREIGSSTFAVAETLNRLTQSPLFGAAERERLEALRDDARAIPSNVKADHLAGFLRSSDEKALVFTQYLRTMHYLKGVLEGDGHRVVIYHGGLPPAAKDAAVRSFRGEGQIFLSTEAGGEGRNLQFARTVVNYDLPWNPLRIEQRIGRVHRLGQTREVHVVNLWAQDTVEAYLMELLDRKIHMFELVVGELDLILGTLDERRSFEDMMMEIWTLRQAEERRAALRRLGDALVRARNQYDAMRERNDEVLRDVSDEVPA